MDEGYHASEGSVNRAGAHLSCFLSIAFLVGPPADTAVARASRKDGMGDDLPIV
jgi:hypothetical protein